MTALRVLSANIQHGLDASGRRTSAEGLADAFAGVRADVVALQEVDRDQPRSGNVDQARVIADALGLPHVRYATVLSGDLRAGKVAAARLGGDGPGYGLAICSRYPVVAWFARTLPRLPVPVPRPTAAGLRAWRDEPRGALAAVLRTPAGPVSVCSTHLSQSGAVAITQLPRVLRSMRGLAEPALVCGDLNLDAWQVAALSRGHRMARAVTFPADRPRRQIDHVLARGVAGLRDVRALRLPVADHRALAATVDLP